MLGSNTDSQYSTQAHSPDCLPTTPPTLSEYELLFRPLVCALAKRCGNRPHSNDLPFPKSEIAKWSSLRSGSKFQVVDWLAALRPSSPTGIHSFNQSLILAHHHSQPA